MPNRAAPEVLRNKTIQDPLIVNNRHQLTTYAVDGAIPTTDELVQLTKGSAAAMTLAAPTAAQEGHRIVITAGSAYAHVVTATGLIHDGITGGAKTTMTFGAFLGASIELVAINLLWHVIGKNVVTIT